MKKQQPHFSTTFSRRAFLLAVMLVLTFIVEAQLYEEKYRPQFHFSPSQGWIGDPCGYAYFEGEYHLMWWGKTTSTDLVHFNEESLFAMTGDPGDFGYWTGCMVVDENNTAGFGPNEMIPVYTMGSDGHQRVGISYSTNQDYTSFQYYSGNPVLDIGSPEFRDPTVFWHEPTSKWVMVITKPDERKVKFYSSVNLKDWTWMSDFGPFGAQEQVWECPDLFQLPVDGNTSNKKWVMVVSMGPNKEQYFLGTFDGTSFTLDQSTSSFLSDGTGMDGDIYEDFDSGNYGNWTITGTAFGSAPSTGTLPNQMTVSGYLGSRLVNSYNGGDGSTGTLTSPVFTITKNNINFLIGGGNHPGQTCINLLINGQVVATSTGSNSEKLKWNGWNVTAYMGQQAQIQIVDNHTQGWGHVLVDHIMFSDILHQENREHALWVDYGSDFYASRTIPDFDGTLTNTSWFGWVSNWEYAHDVPAWNGDGRGQWSIARDLSLKTYSEGVRLIQEPIQALQSLRQSPVSHSGTICGTTSVPGFTPNQNTYEFEATFSTSNTNKFGFNLLVGDGRKLILGYDTRTQVVFLDRTNCTDATINGNFAKILYAPVQPENGKIKLRVFIDQSTVEVFANSGKVVFTALTFPSETQTGVEVFSENCDGTTIEFTGWMLNSIWDNLAVTGVSLNKSESSMIVGETEQLTATVEPVEASNTNVSWNTTNSAIATVDENGLVTAVAEGQAAIIVQTEDGAKTDTCNVVVTSSSNYLIYDFESGNLDGWTVASGNAFSNLDVTSDADWGWGGPFNQQGTYHLWGYKDGGDSQTGTITTQNFSVGGDGQITFLQGGGNDINNLYVALVRVSDGVELMKSTGNDDEGYSSKSFDASSHIGTECYIKVVDNSTGGWGHLNLDNLVIPVEGVPSGLAEGTYRISVRHSGKFMDVDGGGTTNGDIVQQWDWLGGDNQQWMIAESGEVGYYTITSVSGNKVLDADGSTLQVWDSWGGDNQKWQINDLGNGYYAMQNKVTGYAVEVADGSSANGGILQLQNYASGTNQQWDLELLSGSARLTDIAAPDGISTNDLISVYPVPVNDVFNLDLSAFEDQKRFSVEILDVSGKLIKRFENDENLILSISARELGLNSGLYLVKAYSGKKIYTRKIYVE